MQISGQICRCHKAWKSAKSNQDRASPESGTAEMETLQDAFETLHIGEETCCPGQPQQLHPVVMALRNAPAWGAKPDLPSHAAVVGGLEGSRTLPPCSSIIQPRLQGKSTGRKTTSPKQTKLPSKELLSGSTSFS